MTPPVKTFSNKLNVWRPQLLFVAGGMGCQRQELEAFQIIGPETHMVGHHFTVALLPAITIRTVELSGGKGSVSREWFHANRL